MQGFSGLHIDVGALRTPISFRSRNDIRAHSAGKALSKGNIAPPSFWPTPCSERPLIARHHSCNLLATKRLLTDGYAPNKALGRSKLIVKHCAGVGT